MQWGEDTTRHQYLSPLRYTTINCPAICPYYLPPYDREYEGIVTAVCVKQFKQRLSGAGMRWHPENVDRMLVIRSAVLSDDFYQLWEAA